MTLVDSILLFLVALVLVVQIFCHLHGRATDISPHLSKLQNDLQQHQQQTSERTERELRVQVQTTSQSTRQELTGNFSQFQQVLATQITGVATMQSSQIDAFAQQLAKLNEVN